MTDGPDFELRKLIVQVELAIKAGLSVKEACHQVGIDEQKYWEYCEKRKRERWERLKKKLCSVYVGVSAAAIVVLAVTLMYVLHSRIVGSFFIGDPRPGIDEPAWCGIDLGDKDWAGAAAYTRMLADGDLVQLDADPTAMTKTGFLVRALHLQYIKNDPVRAYAYFSLAAADGLPQARALREILGVKTHTPDWQNAVAKFIEVSERNGSTGYLRLGRAFLGNAIFSFAASYRTGMAPFCWPNDFVDPKWADAYEYFEIARLCGSPDADAYLAAMEIRYHIDDATKADLSQQAQAQLDAEVLRKAGGDRTAYCSGSGSGGGPPPPPPQSPPQPVADCGLEPGVPPPPYAQPSAAAAPRRNSPPFERDEPQGAADLSRCYLKSGDAQLAVGNTNGAMQFWSMAIDYGKRYGSQASIIAQKRVQIYSSACEVSPESLSAISRNYQAEHGDLINMRIVQQALHALGDYDGPLDGTFSSATRDAAAKFQREMELDETETLTPYETVFLVCNAAQTARDVASENALGIMYATGLGVVQNTDLALEWMRMASDRGSGDAAFNLAILYGSGTILNSYRLCDIDRSPERADEYLREACNEGQPVARRLMDLYGPRSRRGITLTPEARWRLIEAEQLEKSQADKTGVYASRLKTLGARCPPDRSIQ